MRLSIIVPMGRPETARPTIRAIAGQDHFPPWWELVVVGRDAGLVKKEFPDLPIVPVELSERLIPAATRVRGSERAGGDWLLFVDDDIELASDFLRSMDTVIARLPSPPAAIGARLPGGCSGYFARVTDLANFWSQQCREPGSRPWLYSAAIAVPAQAYRKVGGFNPRFAFGEDVDLTVRLASTCGPVIYEPSLVAVHHHRRTSLRKVMSYFWGNGGLIHYLVENGVDLRPFSPQVVVRNTAQNLRSCRELNARTFPGFARYLPGVLWCYLVFNFSMEWHLQKHIWDNKLFRGAAGDASPARNYVRAMRAADGHRWLKASYWYARAMAGRFWRS